MHLITSCGTSCNTVLDNPHEDKTLRICASDDPISLDPRIGGDGGTQCILRMIFEGLMRLDKNGVPQPATAATYTVSDDAKTYTFQLKKTLWSDGQPVTAKDFEYSWKQVLSPEFPSVFAYAFYTIKNARAAKEGQINLEEVGITAINDYTLKVDLEHPAPYFLELTANPLYSPIPYHIAQEGREITEGIRGHFVSNGPFRVKQRNFRRSLLLEKNPNYWDKKAVHLNGISIHIIPDPETALMMYENNEVDWVGEPLSLLPLDAIPLLKEKNLLNVGPRSTLFWLILNVHCAPLNSIKVRQALACSINRRQIVDYLLVNDEAPAMSILPENLTLATKPYFKDNDIKTAQKLLKEGLDELNMSIDSLHPIKILAPSVRSKLAQVIQEQWSEGLGIPVQLDSSDWGTCLSKMANREYEVATIGWVSWCHDPIYNLEIMRYRSTDKNYSGWENDQYIKLLQASDETFNQEARDHYLREAEKLVISEMPIIPVFSRGASHVKNSAVKGVYLSPLGHPEFKYAYLEK